MLFFVQMRLCGFYMQYTRVVWSWTRYAKNTWIREWNSHQTVPAIR